MKICMGDDFVREIKLWSLHDHDIVQANKLYYVSNIDFVLGEAYLYRWIFSSRCVSRGEVRHPGYVSGIDPLQSQVYGDMQVT